MQILVLGGTVFVGRAIVEVAAERGHEVSIFGRGRTGRELFPGLPRVLGDRSTGDYRSLAGRRFDAVVDVSAYVPRHVAQAASALGGQFAGRYLLISSGSVYDFSRIDRPAAEDAPLLPAERGTEEVTGATYGPLKVACEQEAERCFAAQATIVRPGIVAGPHDPTDRFTWWVRHVAAGGRLPVPEHLDQPVQVVDSRDLARLVVSLLEADRPGTYNAVGPAEPTSFAGLLDACAAAAAKAGRGGPLERVVVGAGLELPLVLDPGAPWLIFQRDSSAARAAGLTATSLAQTAADVLEWDEGRGSVPLVEGPSAERLQAALAAGLPL